MNIYGFGLVIHKTVTQEGLQNRSTRNVFYNRNGYTNLIFDTNRSDDAAAEVAACMEVAACITE